MDRYTLYTFLALGLSFLMFLIYRGLDICLGFALGIAEMEGPQSLQKIKDWEHDHFESL